MSLRTPLGNINEIFQSSSLELNIACIASPDDSHWWNTTYNWICWILKEIRCVSLLRIREKIDIPKGRIVDSVHASEADRLLPRVSTESVPWQIFLILCWIFQDCTTQKDL